MTPPVRSPEESADPLVRRLEDRESSARTYSRRLPIALATGSGCTVRDTGGRDYIDCLAGAGSVALGHHHPVVVDALRAAIDGQVPLTTLDMATPLRDAFTEELFGALPPGLRDGRIQFCGPTGSDAVEAALKLVRTATGRPGVVAFGGAYHGMTQGALAASGAHAPRVPLGPMGGEVHHLPFPATYRCPFGVGGEEGARLCARAVEWALTDDHSGITPPAGVIVEPVQGEGGVMPAPRAFARALRALTRAAGVPLIADEVQTGLGRTGALWASEAIDLDPDVMVLSKAIGGGLPLAVIVYRRELDRWAPGAHAGTFRGNQLAMAAGAATIRHVVATGLHEHAAVMGARLDERLREASAGVAAVGEVRGRGLMLGVELVDPATSGPGGVPLPDGDMAAAVQRAMLDLGVIVESGGRGGAVVRFLPPLVISADEVDRVGAAFAEALRLAGAGR